MTAADLTEARAALLRRVDEAVGQQRAAEAIEILRALTAALPADPGVRGRYADMLRQHGQREEAAAEAVALAQEMRARRDDVQAARILNAALRADPGRDTLVQAVAQLERTAEERRGRSEIGHKHLIQTVRQGVDSHPGRVSAQTRYDLGIAYKSMDLFDEAVAELKVASRDPRLAFDCMNLIAACCEGKGAAAEALTWLERGLAVPGRAPEEYGVVRAEMARLRRASL